MDLTLKKKESKNERGGKKKREDKTKVLGGKAEASWKRKPPHFLCTSVCVVEVALCVHFTVRVCEQVEL